MANSRKNNDNPTFKTPTRTYEEKNSINHKPTTLSPEQYTLLIKLESLKATIQIISTHCETRKHYGGIGESCKNYQLKEKTSLLKLNQQLTQKDSWEVQVECASMNYYFIHNSAWHQYNNEYSPP